jgi:uncharacterized Zn-finger protein
VLDDAKLPSKVCQMCLSLLKISYEFQVQFKNSQRLLENVKEASTKKIVDLKHKFCEESAYAKSQDKQLKALSAAPVELIYGENKFDLGDVVVIEEEKEEDFSFEGFLKNLGKEISAEFVKEANVTKSPPVQASVEQTLKKFDVERLKVKTYPEESKIVIEEVDLKMGGFNPTSKVIRTLFECDKCKKVFLARNDLESHTALIHEPPSRYICEKCGHIAQTSSSLYHHMQKHKSKQHECDKCDKKFVTSSRLKNHLQVHKNERLFLCNVCGKNFNYAIALSYHLRLHTGEKKYICNYCGLRYRMANTLKRHLRTHTRDKPYHCSYCDKKFSSQGEKVAHERLHTGVRPYHCEYCGKKFAKSSNLQYHYLSHPGPHECHICRKTFIEVKFLKLHVKRVHKEMEN